MIDKFQNSYLVNGFKWLSCYLFITFFVACGGSSSENIEDSADTIAPIITLIGDSEITLLQGESYVELGATAIDDHDDFVFVSITGSVDSTTIGSYTITYSATDLANNSTSITRLINVVETPDTTAPVITLNGSPSVSLVEGEVYVELGATAIDDRDDEISVVVSGTVNSNVVGVYIITYTATDESSNSTELTRTVNVVAASLTDVFDLSNTDWASNCHLVEQGHPETEEDTYQRSEQHYNENATSVDLDVYIYEPDNNTCSGNESFLYSSTYNIVIETPFVTDGGLDAYEIDFDLIYESIPNSWSQRMFDIIYRDDDNLYLGIDGSDNEQARPTALNFEFFYTQIL